MSLCRRAFTKSPSNRLKQLEIHTRFSCLQKQRIQTDADSTSTANNDYHLNFMKEHNFVLGHMNYARLKAPLEDPSMTEFRLAIGPVNELAKTTPGFVWSFDNDVNCDDYEGQRARVELLRKDPLLMPQLSLWTGVSPLKHFAFKSGHAIYYRRKKEWFTMPADIGPPFAVCWWHDVTAHDGNPPTLQQAFERCFYLKKHGPSVYAFDFSTASSFPMPSSR